MNTTEPPTVQRAPVWLLVLAVVLPVAIVIAVLWFVWIGKPAQEGQKITHEIVLRTSGLANPTSNRLDARFTDADGDLVADPPADPARQIDPPTLFFSYVAVDDPEAYKQAFKELVAHISAVTGKPAVYVAFTSTSDQLKAIRDGKLHVAGLNTGAVPIAVNLCGFVPLCKLSTEDGVASYRMQIIVPADSLIKAVGDLRNRELTLTEPGSNSGFKAPLVLLRNRFGLEPERDYQLRFSGGHENSIKGIADKTYQAAAVAGDILDRAIAHGDIAPNQYRSIYESEAFPTACLGYVYNLKPELAAKVRQAVFSFEWKGTALEKEFASSSQTKFVPANFKDDWALVRSIDEATGVAYKID